MMDSATKVHEWTVRRMNDVIAVEFAIGMIEMLQAYVADVIKLDCGKCPFYNGYRCLLSGCLGQNDTDLLFDNLKNYERRCKDAAD